MKKIVKKINVCILACVTSVLAFKTIASEEPMTIPVSAELIKELIVICKQNAVEDEIDKAEMNSYILECVNDELSYSNLKPIAKKELAAYLKISK
ncbi:hypothetical protein SOPP22_13160 [Shewanella sp. OPT22]|nr:hypothetical protein SOPP22_13160 [Shewanella sp. OPT22]